MIGLAFILALVLSSQLGSAVRTGDLQEVLTIRHDGVSILANMTLGSPRTPPGAILSQKPLRESESCGLASRSRCCTRGFCCNDETQCKKNWCYLLDKGSPGCRTPSDCEPGLTCITDEKKRESKCLGKVDRGGHCKAEKECMHDYTCAIREPSKGRKCLSKVGSKCGEDTDCQWGSMCRGKGEERKCTETQLGSECNESWDCPRRQDRGSMCRVDGQEKKCTETEFGSECKESWDCPMHRDRFGDETHGRCFNNKCTKTIPFGDACTHPTLTPQPEAVCKEGGVCLQSASRCFVAIGECGCQDTMNHTCRDDQECRQCAPPKLCYKGCCF